MSSKKNANASSSAPPTGEQDAQNRAEVQQQQAEPRRVLRPRHQTAPPETETVPFEEFEVETILDSRERNGRMEYLVKWQDYPSTENTWEPESSFTESGLKLLRLWKRDHGRRSSLRSRKREPTPETPQDGIPNAEGVVMTKKLRKDLTSACDRVFVHMEVLSKEVAELRKEQRPSRDRGEDSQPESGGSQMLLRSRAAMKVERPGPSKPAPAVASTSRDEPSDTERERDTQLEFAEKLATFDRIKKERDQAILHVGQLQGEIQEMEARVQTLTQQKDDHVAKRAQLASIILGKPVSNDEVAQEGKFQEVVAAFEKLKLKADHVVRAKAVLNEVAD